MASFKVGRRKPWKARVRQYGEKEEFLGYYETEDEAVCVEYDYGRKLPGEGGHGQKRRRREGRRWVDVFAAEAAEGC